MISPEFFGYYFIALFPISFVLVSIHEKIRWSRLTPEQKEEERFADWSCQTV